MRNKIDERVPRYSKLLMPTFIALKELGNSGSNNEILNQIVKDLKLSDEIVDIPHISKYNSYQSELAYQLAWARTYLSKYGVINNSTRAIWSICPEYLNRETLDEKAIVNALNGRNKKYTSKDNQKPEDNILDNDEIEFPDEVKPWRNKLSEVLQEMDPYGFERLAQRVLRESGFSQVEVTKKSGDGGIDGKGKLKINGMFSFNVAFQCKRYKGSVSASDIRDFRGSLTTDIEKGILITTGTFTREAIEDASTSGKKQIDLIDGEEYITKIAELGIGVKEIKTYEIDEDFFKKI